MFTPVIKRKFMGWYIKICWWGTFIPLHGLDKILQAMKILKEHELQFTCIVDNPHFTLMQKKFS